MSNLITVFQGMIMGVAEVIPGVSGSTFALIMGIYDDFIDLLHQVSQILKTVLQIIFRKAKVKDLKEEFKKFNLKFAIFLFVGMLISVAIFSHIFTYLLDNYPRYVSSFFFGLVIASVSIPWKEMTVRTKKEILIILITAISAFLLLGLKPTKISGDPHYIILFFGGVIGITGMVLPGLSGSFILLLFGIYDYVINLVKNLTKLSLTTDSLVRLLIFISGMVVGFSIFVRILKWLLNKYPNQLMAFLIGLMIGSLRIIYPFFEIDSQNEELHNIKYPWDFSPKEVALTFIIASIAFSFVVVLNKTKIDRKQIEHLEEDLED